MASRLIARSWGKRWIGSTSHGTWPDSSAIPDLGESHVELLALGNSSAVPSSTAAPGRELPRRIAQARLWKPFALSRPVLFGFIALALLCSTIVGLLFHISSAQSGLLPLAKVLHSSQRYLWTYVPTAFFTLVSVAWGGVDYRAKQMMPWVVMRQGPGAAEKNVLLDYVTPLNIVTLFRAAKGKHWLTAGAVTGTLSLQIIVTLSTGFFIQKSVAVTQSPSAGALLTVFDPEHYRNAIYLDDPGYHMENAKPWQMYLGTSSFQLPYPNGTTDVSAYQQFYHTTYQNESIAAVVDVFSADLTCELLDVQEITNHPGDHTALHASSKTCANISFNISAEQLRDQAEDLVFAVAQSCRNQGSIDEAMRQAFVAGSFSNTSTISRPNDYLAIACKPAYEIRKATVTWNSTASLNALPEISFLPQNQSEPQLLPNFTAWNVAENIASSFCSMRAVNLASYCSGQGYTTYDTGYNPYARRTMSFLDTLNATSPQQKASNFKDFGTLSKAASKFYKSWTAQMAGLNLAVEAQGTLVTERTVVESRLFLRGAAVPIAEGALILLALCSLYLLWISSTAVMSRDPSSIGGLATLLAGSARLVDKLKCGGAMVNDDMIRRRLEDSLFELRIRAHDGCSGIDIWELPATIESPQLPATILPSEQDDNLLGPRQATFYIPLSVSRVAMATMFLLPICIMLVLEVLYRFSQKNHGIVDILDHGIVHYAWSYVPAIFMTAVSLLYGALESVVKSFQPFHAFQQGLASANVGLLDNYLSQTALQTLWSAILKRQWGAMAIAVSSLTTPFLTIFVSGLFYSSNDLRYTKQGQVWQTDRFNTGMQSYSPKPFDAWWSNGMIVLNNGNMSYPGGTYDRMVLPGLRLKPADWVQPNGNQTNAGANARVRTTVKALRANANCTAFESGLLLQPYSSVEDTTTLDYDDFTGPYEKTWKFSANLPHSQCITPNHSQGAEVDSGYNSSFYFQFTGSMNYTGYWYDLEASSSILHANNSLSFQEEYPDCPRVITLFAGATREQKVSNLTAFYCTPFVEKVDVDVTLTYPDLSIDPTNPPTANDATAEIFSSAMLHNIEHQFAPLGPGGLWTSNDRYFYDVMVWGRDAIDPSLIVGKSNEDLLRSKIMTLYGQAAANYLNTQRTPLGGSDETFAYNATLFHATHTRLVQDHISTRVLQGLLALVVVCGITAFATMHTRRILPINPNSIAGLASLLAGADMLDRRVIPEGSEWLNDGELKQHGVFEGYMFSLGWWAEGENMRFGIDIGRADMMDK